jgi:hypothetical protein
MSIRRAFLPGILTASILAAAGCGALAPGVEPSPSAAEAAGPAPDRAAVRAEPGRLTDIVAGRPGEPLSVAAAGSADTADLRPGALLDVWLNDRQVALRTLTNEPSLGTAVVRGDFFRYNAVNADAALRDFWGQELVLRWSAFLEVPERGAHVFVSELSKERGYGAMGVRTLVRLNDVTLFEEELRVHGYHRISETGSHVMTLEPGFHRLEVWLAASGRTPPPATLLGTYLKIRAPGAMTAEPVRPPRIWHRVRPRT